MKATLPGKAWRHALDLLDALTEGHLIEALRAGERRRRGKGYQVVVELAPGHADELADRFDDWAEVERQAAAFGDGADYAIARACETAAERLREGAT